MTLSLHLHNKEDGTESEKYKASRLERALVFGFRFENSVSSWEQNETSFCRAV